MRFPDATRFLPFPVDGARPRSPGRALVVSPPSLRRAAVGALAGVVSLKCGCALSSSSGRWLVAAKMKKTCDCGGWCGHPAVILALATGSGGGVSARRTAPAPDAVEGISQ